ncbi:Procollagen-lysine,2-oxoglutarate 5-dioxygenase 1 [Dermatophagoides pteronyssinus]|uniref:procollagen-lysine 5-dioxygenase n=1 Tax=Dermatophagoides pteronyssinus TaxID=6956 RepID=A0ABQ8IRE3_DERPT|nr:Procollagen-lysine,2-oxoglutarate 5-dioxygenase 1 [Dermatophagoides pteronyssinus]
MNNSTIITIFFILLSLIEIVLTTRKVKDLIVVSVSTHITDGFERFNRSLKIYGLKSEILGLNQPWKGGDVARQSGGGQKIRLLRQYLESIRNEHDNRLILFTDSYDVIVNGNSDEIVKKFQTFNANVVFSSEKYCWPDVSLAASYPKSDGKRYLNSGGFIGFATELYKIVNLAQDLNDDDDDQLFYTKIYLEQKYRKHFGIRLDLNSYLFQNLNGEIGDVEIRFNNIDHEDYPHVLMAIIILKPTPFFPEFLDYLKSMDYPKNRITIFIQSNTDFHNEQIGEFSENSGKFHKNFQYSETKLANEWQLRNNYLDECQRINCDYLFVVDSDVRLTNSKTLHELIEANRSIIAPMLVRPKEYWSNFWGTITNDGYYSRSHDYVQIIKNERRGIWNVPFISSCYLIKSSTILNQENFQTKNQQWKFPLSYRNHQQPQHKNDDIDGNGNGGGESLDPEMYFCHILRLNGIFMFVTNENDYGHLAQMDTIDFQLKHSEFYEIYTNEIEWRKRYIHENYTKNLLDDNIIEQPCHDVYWFPIVTPVFCQHLIEIMENNGEWSAGKNEDPRLAGGYENVPTVDIHMKQVGLEQQWLYFLREYVRPVQEKIFIGYYHDPPQAIMNFVVRYHPNEQAFLRPHHDASTYTVNIALNRPNIDYEGGGCRFIRQNCSITNLRVGWSLIHPGRLTHFHEGLTVTKGVRYIMVSFVDP